MSLGDRKVHVAAAGVLLLAASLWGLTSYFGGNDEGGVALPAELTVAALRARSQENPDQMRETMRTVFEREDLTDEQRRQARENMRQVWRAEMEARIDEYFAAPLDQRLAILDRHIDEWQERMERFREMREQRRREREAREEQAQGERDGPRRERRDWRAAPTQQRKERSEGRSADQIARRMAYRSAMRQRMADRGIEPSWGDRGGRRGGFGRRGGQG